MKPFYGPMAEMAKRLPRKQEIMSSSLVGTCKKCHHNHLVSLRIRKRTDIIVKISSIIAQNTVKLLVIMIIFLVV